jgi:hypothetical protein
MPAQIAARPRSDAGRLTLAVVTGTALGLGLFAVYDQSARRPGVDPAAVERPAARRDGSHPAVQVGPGQRG